MEGNTARGASSPAKPALHIPDPLSTTRAAISSSIFWIEKQKGGMKGGYCLKLMLCDSYGLHLANISLAKALSLCRMDAGCRSGAGSSPNPELRHKGSFSLGLAIAI